MNSTGHSIEFDQGSLRGRFKKLSSQKAPNTSLPPKRETLEKKQGRKREEREKPDIPQSQLEKALDLPGIQGSPSGHQGPLERR